MQRRDFLKATTLGALAISAAGYPMPINALPSRRQNVLFIAVDDLKPLIGAFGATHVHTPHMDRLATRGMIFENNHCQQAICGPSRASLMTGLRPDTTKVWDLRTPMRRIIPDVVTLPQQFMAHGYTTTATGKIYDGRCVDNGHGWVSQDTPSWSSPARKVGGTRYALPRNENNLKPTTECANVPDEVYKDYHSASNGIEIMSKCAAGDAPWFVGVGFNLPHLPFAAPKKYWDLYDPATIEINPVQQRPEGTPFFVRQNSGELRSYSDAPKRGPIPVDFQRRLIHGYYASVSFADAQVGRLLDHLDHLGETDNTIVCLWGDHGWHLGDHGMFCKHTNYEQATRSPLILAAPGTCPEGASTAAPTEFVDIYPTLCDLAGIELRPELEGTSLVPLMGDPASSVKPVAISQYPRRYDKKNVMGYAYRDQRYRYVEWEQKKFRDGETTGPVVLQELYDYEVDPLERRNLADDLAYADQLKRMIALARATRTGT